MYQGTELIITDNNDILKCIKYEVFTSQNQIMATVLNNNTKKLSPFATKFSIFKSTTKLNA